MWLYSSKFLLVEQNEKNVMRRVTVSVTAQHKKMHNIDITRPAQVMHFVSRAAY